jgi:AcrR family transcriptional regulator
MVEPVKRRYNSAGRRAAAEHTRRAIIDAATRLFLRDGYVRTSIEAIAAAADVAPATVYKVFGTKAAIVKDVGDVAVAGDHQPVPVAERSWVADSLTQPDPHRALQTAVAGAAATLERISPIIDMVTAAAHAEPGLIRLVEGGSQGRRHNISTFIKSLQKQGSLRRGLSVDEATDITWALLSPATYGDLVRRRQWSHDRYVDLLTAQLDHALLGGEISPSRSGPARRRHQGEP